MIAARHLRAAFGYFSILPVGASVPPPGAGTLAVLPLVGAVVGAAAGAAAYGIALVAPHPIAVAAAFVLPILLTGAIHYDGFLDSCDALFASVPLSRKLEIFKDPRHGTYALIGMSIATVLCVASLWAIAPQRWCATLAFTGALSRLAVIPNALFVPYVHGGTAHSALEERPPIAAIALETSLLALAGWALAGGAGIALVAIAIACGIGYGHILKRSLGGGLVGDVYGYLIVCVEIALFIALAVIYARTAL